MYYLRLQLTLRRTELQGTINKSLNADCQAETEDFGFDTRATTASHNAMYRQEDGFDGNNDEEGSSTYYISGDRADSIVSPLTATQVSTTTTTPDGATNSSGGTKNKKASSNKKRKSSGDNVVVVPLTAVEERLMQQKLEALTKEDQYRAKEVHFIEKEVKLREEELKMKADELSDRRKEQNIVLWEKIEMRLSSLRQDLRNEDDEEEKERIKNDIRELRKRKEEITGKEFSSLM